MEADTRKVGSLRGLETAAMWVMAGAMVLFYFWTADLSGALRVAREPLGSYNLQTEGFRQGHLYMAAEPNPALLALPDPYDPVANAPYRMHDVTLWRGKYYLYFGAAPILLVFLPFRLLSGYFVSEPMVVALFTSLGLLVSVKLLADVRRRFFPAAHPLLFLALVAVLGLGCPTLLLNQMPQFYQVPIACAYALGMAGLLCILKVFCADEKRRARWLVASGICVGLTLAARPNYLLAMPLLLLPVWWCVREEDALRAGWRKWRPWALLAFAPVAAVGGGLLVYNWLRFGDPFEFGMRYQLAGQSFVNFTPLSLDYFQRYFGIYVWQKIWWQPYFPFFESEPEVPFGILRYLPITWLGLLAFWPCRLAGEKDSLARIALAGVVFWLGAATLVMDSLFFFGPELRYVSDYSPALILLGALGALTVAQLGPRARWAVPALALAAAASLATVLAVYEQRMPDERKPASLARVCNRVAAIVERAVGQRYGGLKLEVELPKEPAAAVEPLFQTGHSPDRRDWLQVHYLPENQAQLEFFHAGLGLITGKPFVVPRDRRLTINVASSAFLPPGTHPMFESWTPAEIVAAQRRLEIKVNGTVVLAAALPCYPSRPWDLQLGATGFEGDAARLRFSGRVISAVKIPAQREAAPPRELAGIHGVLQLRLQLPALGQGYDPLIGTGEKSRGQLLYLIYGPDHTVQFALDTIGRGVLYSRALKYNPAGIYTVTAWLGAWAVGTKGQADESVAFPAGVERRLYVKLDDQVLFDLDHPFLPGADSPTAIGWNRIGSGAAGPEFSGRILSARQEALSTLPPSIGSRYGAVDMQLVFPTTALGQVEPLVTTGESGAGDIVFVRYVDATHVIFGLDHWGVGGPSTDPVSVDYSQQQHVEISMGSLYPEGDPSMRRHLLVRLNDEVILDTTTDFYPSSADQVQVFYNSIGGSVCTGEFTGQVISIERPERLKQ